MTSDDVVPAAPGAIAAAEPTRASALIFNDAGEYLLHLRDHIPGIWEPGAWSLLGGGREPGDRSLEDTVRRELREEAGLDLPVLERFGVVEAVGDASTVSVQVFAGLWNGDPAALVLTEGVMLHWFRPETMPRLTISPSTLDLVRSHAGAYGIRVPEARPDVQRAGRSASPVPRTTIESAEPCRGFWADTARIRSGYLAEVPTQTLVLKVAEEVGEVAEAYIGMTGGNPRKGVHKNTSDVLDELADVMLSAAVPMVDLAGGAAQAEAHMARRLGFVSARDVAAPPTGGGWHGSFIAPHVLLQRQDGWVLMLRRFQTGYADGLLCPPAGRIEPGEDVLAAAIREAGEEAGVRLRREDARFVHVMHRTAPTLPGPCHAVSDYWFRFDHWEGEPHAAEPDKASEALWIDPASPPDDVIGHCALALAAITHGEPFSVHGWT
ncbi:NUDIX domain-containing protein [Actinomadura violacea]|uniref:NUDIX domain-containing protein n=1 Tax=Actinomadura violacea TaxID=2819934 RepID=A0ABS3RP69_9ACTN|nr:NUDIX domain-containing protein [Actinomadura violacea]MBO2458343.1 NUDIX domain-containing protein [Actinomadura violacea]